MSTNTKTLAKSLHTVTALVQVARFDMEQVRHDDPTLTPEHSVERAAEILGYAFCSDPYGLKQKAVAIHKAEAAKAAAADHVAAFKKLQYAPDNMSARAVALAGNAE